MGFPATHPDDRIYNKLSQRGYNFKILRLKADLAKNIAYYLARCGDYPLPPCKEVKTEEQQNNEFELPDLPDWHKWIFGILGRALKGLMRRETS